MKTSIQGAVLALALFMMVGPAIADELGEADRIVCSAVHANRCFADGECVSGPPWNWNIPQFIIIDLEANELRTTQASGERRMTPIRFVERDGDNLYLQGVEGGRAFSFVIDQTTGIATVGIALDGVAVAAFGACTPLPVGEVEQ